MAKVLGFGGVFFKSRDPEGLRAWYQKHLGFPEGSPHFPGVIFFSKDGPAETHAVWSPFSESTDYFAPSDQNYMINFRVDDLDGMMAQLAEAGIDGVGDVEEMEGIGRFGWILDPEGNKIELWQPA